MTSMAQGATALKNQFMVGCAGASHLVAATEEALYHVAAGHAGAPDDEGRGGHGGQRAQQLCQALLYTDQPAAGSSKIIILIVAFRLLRA